MRRTNRYFLEEWAYLFSRRGDAETAALLLGALDASFRETGTPLQPNEQRLVASVRAALAGAMPPDVLATHLAAGAALGEESLPKLLSEALAKAPKKR
jgi:hypothetical protein